MRVRRTSSFDIHALLIAMEPDIYQLLVTSPLATFEMCLTGHQNISVVSDKVFQNLFRTVNDINIAPINPRMLVRQGGCEKVIPCSAHGLPSRTLGFEGVSLLDILAQLESK